MASVLHSIQNLYSIITYTYSTYSTSNMRNDKDQRTHSHVISCTIRYLTLYLILYLESSSRDGVAFVPQPFPLRPSGRLSVCCPCSCVLFRASVHARSTAVYFSWLGLHPIFIFIVASFGIMQRDCCDEALFAPSHSEALREASRH